MLSEFAKQNLVQFSGSYTGTKERDFIILYYVLVQILSYL